MKLLVVILVAVAAAAAEGESPPIWKNYHEEAGIPAARRIWLMEQSVDFDGSRIVGGQPAQLGSSPHLGGLIILLTDNRQSVCGSSLLSNKVAVTAGHCWRHGFMQARQFTVVLGSLLLFSGGTRVISNDVVVHPNYNMLNLNNDLAIIKLPFVTFTNHIQTIRLPTSQEQFVGVWLTAAGFGANGHNQPITQAQAKHEARLQVITNAACQQVYGSSVVIASTLCTATTAGQSTCPGDSGGSLTIVHPSRPGDRVLAGVTSFGHVNGCESGFPAGFARVTNFAVWLNTFI